MGKGKCAFLPYFGGKLSEPSHKHCLFLPDSRLSCPGAHGCTAGLFVVDNYAHMGHRTFASGNLQPEIAARHASSMPYINRLTHRFFADTSVDVARKLSVAGSLTLSRELYGSASYPKLSVTERQRVHSNVTGVLRKATQETFTGVGKVAAHMLSDAQIFKVYEIRTPYVSVRFARLRMSVRLFGKAPFDSRTLPI